MFRQSARNSLYSSYVSNNTFKDLTYVSLYVLFVKLSKDDFAFVLSYLYFCSHCIFMEDSKTKVHTQPCTVSMPQWVSHHRLTSEKFIVDVLFKASYFTKQIR